MQTLDHNLIFPHPSSAPDHGLLAIGGDLSVERLLLAYQSGIFPWYSDGDPICWWSPDPRMVFDLQSDEPMRVTKSLKQSQRNKGYIIKENTCFTEVMHHCALVKRQDETGTWINDDFISSYSRLHELGHAKSIEVFKEDVLVGGLYGIDLPEKKIFCGESMFTLATDASKIALLHLVKSLKSKDYHFIDAQLYNDHLHSLGAIEIDREVFLSYL
ncbi:leucyl/phenylalanyl-tRNA--protein transferase [Nonlabens ulvanivorans]|uniref:leucyl/phenylalanyl-tRNA--protein transferase n=1 Tax=Nonlabens ulvanivorans TaxID=906888 RepID=UPI0029422F33|nr:leucyl/phenylalanyl-tRNA--protein transferase [Nonlabens ulvanivorans]WOI22533.1 leucyl/phenylalanyl-tRNA--protein transferase [Nonlabens ulvanivorans]